jgi:prophage antirepressor-like protein
MTKKEKEQNNIVIYKSPQGVTVEVRMEEDTVWLDARQIAGIFGTQRPAIVKHINNIYKTSELSQKATCSILEQVAADGKIRKMNIYNLDMIISVGYRVNSKQATQFRVWATSVLKKYLIDGYAINEKLLEEARKNFDDLQSVIQLLGTKISSENLKGQEQEIFSLLADYSKTLSVLEQYDKSSLKEPKGGKSRFVLKHEDALSVLASVHKALMAKNEATDLFANERDGSFGGIVKGLYQTFGGKELYKSVEDKAAHLLYFTIKDHPFSDGNKRSAAFLFVYFLDRNKYLHKKSGEKKINDNALAALALLVAESDPKEKDTMIKLIVNLITE